MNSPPSFGVESDDNGNTRPVAFLKWQVLSHDDGGFFVVFVANFSFLCLFEFFILYHTLFFLAFFIQIYDLHCHVQYPFSVLIFLVQLNQQYIVEGFTAGFMMVLASRLSNFFN